MAQTGGTYHRESSWSYSVSIGEPDARPSKPSHDAEKGDETKLSEDWEVVEWPIAQSTVEPVEEPVVDDTEPEEPGYRRDKDGPSNFNLIHIHISLDITNLTSLHNFIKFVNFNFVL
ncbi:hypothetical protein J4E86_007078 [Alternaria arbusti]|uniref:uncharacterized protein n=1 Tax=Alternaria arbusti TaxID=232088 RepID=UPI0022201FAA|nr:uncharacterized protein J4E86_007078 [Alternaria arbusti]KAI4951662.1 hypothetical protein J4E86_007078 [Alternaria arbusti]